jgi:hypothetical protein
MKNVFIYNDNMDDVALHQVAELEQAEGKSFDRPTYSREKLDQRDLEILIDCLEAGFDVYDEEFPAMRIKRMVKIFQGEDWRGAKL